MTLEQLGRAAELYFAGRARAAHILTCDICDHDDTGRFVACPRCPAARGDDRAVRERMSAASH